MTHEDFEQQLLDEIYHQLPTGSTVRIQEIRKNNGVLKRTVIIESKGSSMAPTIYMDQFFEEYEKGVPMRHLVRLILHQYEKAMKKQPESTNFFHDYEKVRSHLFCKVINAEKNKDYLDNIPHRKWQDLAIVCYYQVDPKWIEDASIQITSNHVRIWNVTEEEVLEEAMHNTVRLMQPKLDKLSTILQEHFDLYTPEPDELPLYLLTNHTKKLGAVCILYPGEAAGIAQQLQSDFYVIPSSIHECLILPDNGHYQIQDLNHMIREINESQVDDQEVLADHAYLYRNGTFSL